MRLIRVVSTVLLLSLSGLLTSCTVNSTQLSTLQNTLTASDDALEPYRWRLSRAGYVAEVFAVTTDDGKTVFANEVDDWVAFDGWMITVVKGLGLTTGELVIKGAVGERWFSDGNWPLNKHYCDPWRASPELQSTIYAQDCTGDQSYTNLITVDRQGMIVKIQQNIGLEDTFSNNPLVLEKR